MTRSGLLSYRADDHADNGTAATQLAGAASASDATRSSAGATGNIERTGDADWMTFTAGAGAATVTVSLVPVAPYYEDPRANADVQIAMYAAGTTGLPAAQPLAKLDPQGALLSGALAVTLPAAGKYFLQVVGVGDSPNGYTSYG